MKVWFILQYVVDPYDKSNEGDNTEIHHPLSQAEDVSCI